MTYDLAIIGGGPAGVGAGVYAARKKLKTVFITKNFEGQSAVSLGIENWIGNPMISGQELAKSLEKHLKIVAKDIIDIKEGELATELKKSDNVFEIATNKNTYSAKTVLITTGSRRRPLEAPGAKEFDNKGLTYCASCDGPLFADMDVAVIGGGNAGFDTAAQLLAYCKSVTLLSRSDFRADPQTVEAALKNKNFKAVKNTEVVEVKGDKFVNTIVYKDRTTGEKTELSVKGIFVEIGSLPNADFAKSILETDEFGHIKINPKNQETSIKGVWAAGDVTDGLYHQNNIAAGDAVKAVEDIYLYLHKNS